MEHAVPGAQFYRDNLERAQALPEAERSADVAAWLAADAVMTAATPSLPEMPCDGTVLTQPAGGDAALTALLQFLAHLFACPPADPLHPTFTLRCFGTQLPPLMKVWLHNDRVMMQPQPQLADILTTGRMPSAEPDLALVARLLLLAAISVCPEIQQASIGVEALQALKPALLGDAAAARLNRQLQQLQQRLAGAGAGGDPELPTARHLQVAWHALLLRLTVDVHVPEVLPPWRVSALGEEAARGLLQLEPNNPRSSLAMGKVAVMNHRLLPGPAVACAAFDAALLPRLQMPRLARRLACRRPSSPPPLQPQPHLSAGRPDAPPAAWCGAGPGAALRLDWWLARSGEAFGLGRALGSTGEHRLGFGGVGPLALVDGGVAARP